MNSLQLFRMYRRFIDERDDTERGEDKASPHGWTEWKEWNHLARITQSELERRLGSQSLTGINLVTAFSSLFAELEPETPEEVDATLQEFGYDPDEIGARIKDAADRALEELKLAASASAGFRY